MTHSIFGKAAGVVNTCAESDGMIYFTTFSGLYCSDHLGPLHKIHNKRINESKANCGVWKNNGP